MSARIRGLYAITPDDADTPRLTAMVDAALTGGARIVQYRNKHASAGLAHEQAEALAACCARHGALFVVNDHVELALAIPGAGLHVGRDDAGDLPALRTRLGNRVLGVSCYDQPALAEAAVAAGANYVAFGSVFPSSTKPAAVRAPLSLFAGPTAVPRVGIGGITIDHLPALIAAGADAAAVISELFADPDPAVVKARARAMARLFDPSPT